MWVKGCTALAAANCACSAGIRSQEPLPGMYSVHELQFRSDAIAGRHTSTGDAVIESENPDPPAIEDVMDRCGIDRVRRRIGGSMKRCIRQTPRAGEMAVQGLGGGKPWQRALLLLQCAMEEAAWTCGIDDDFRSKGQCVAVARAFQNGFAGKAGDSAQGNTIQIIDAQLLRFFHEKMIEIRPVPVRIGNFVAGARGHQQLILPRGVRCWLRSEPMVVKRKAALQSTGNIGTSALPAAPL